MLEISFGVQEAQLEQEILEKFHFFSPVPGVVLSPWVSCCCPMEKPLHPPQNSLQTNPKKILELFHALELKISFTKTLQSAEN